MREICDSVLLPRNLNRWISAAGLSIKMSVYKIDKFLSHYALFSNISVKSNQEKSALTGL